MPWAVGKCPHVEPTGGAGAHVTHLAYRLGWNSGFQAPDRRLDHVPFDSPDLNLSNELLKDVGLGKIRLPDFQRDWKWR
jgi:hypothetical protein